MFCTKFVGGKKQPHHGLENKMTNVVKVRPKETNIFVHVPLEERDYLKYTCCLFSSNYQQNNIVRFIIKGDRLFLEPMIECLFYSG